MAKWMFYVMRNQRAQKEYFISTYNKRSYDDKFFKGRTIAKFEIPEDDHRSIKELANAYERGDFTNAGRSNISESERPSDISAGNKESPEGTSPGNPGPERETSGT